jgi:predicted metal-dependent phosphoesterase TrpH
MWNTALGAVSIDTGRVGHNEDMRFDLHTHSRVSDGTDDPAELVRRVGVAGLDGVALTDHDTLAGVSTARDAGRRYGVAVLPGMELTCEVDGVTVHLLGLGLRSGTPLDAETAHLRAVRDCRVDVMLRRLAACGIVLTRAQVEAAAGPAATLGRPHVADAMVAAGYVTSRTEAFARWLDEGRPGYVSHQRVPLRTGIARVRQAGGVAVIAHAWMRASKDVLTVDYLSGLARADDAGPALDGLEVYHQGHTAAMRAQLARLADECGFIVTGGSDYHGTGKVDHDLGCNTTDMENWERIDALIDARGGVTARARNA